VQHVRPPLVASLMAGIIVLSTVEFDRKANSRTIEINDVRSERMLATET